MDQDASSDESSDSSSNSGGQRDEGVNEVIPLDLTPAFQDVNLKHHIAVDRARTENLITKILVVAVVASFPVLLLYFGFLNYRCSAAEQHLDVVMSAYDRWVTLVGPLAGAAVGIGVQSRRSDQ